MTSDLCSAAACADTGQGDARSTLFMPRSMMPGASAKNASAATATMPSSHFKIRISASP
jgi:hypothetical protein